jgi:MYXO-CTERM domain-containing protein
MSRWIGLSLLIAGCTPTVDEFNQASTLECTGMVVEGVDVYQNDTPIVWSTVQSSGRGFAFSKASQGISVTESNFATNWSQLKSVGMLRGAYHYFDARYSGVDQANWFLKQLNDAGGLGPGDLPPALDIECPTSPTQSSAGNHCLDGPSGPNGWAPTPTIIQEAWDWLDTVEAATGMKPVIYSYLSWFGDFGFTDPKLADYPLWLADPPKSGMPSCFTVPAPWTQATIWQYSSSMVVPGIGNGSQKADEDRFLGTAAQLNAFALGDIIGPDGGGADGMSALPDLAPDDAMITDLRSAPSDLDMPGASADGAAVKKTQPDRGCGCQLGGGPAPIAGWPLFAVALVVVVALRRRRLPLHNRDRAKTVSWLQSR